MKRLLLLFFIVNILFVALSCSDRSSRHIITSLQEIGDMVSVNPDFAKSLLESLVDSIDRDDNITLDAHACFEKMKIEYRLGIDLDDYEELTRVADYFSKKGSVNEKLLTIYFLGLYYIDQGDMPLALDNLNQCVVIIDDNEDKIDLVQASKVYSQLFRIFHEQKLPYYEIDALQKAKYYSERANDDYLTAWYEDLMIRPYSLLGQVDSVIAVSERTANMYYAMGLDSIGNIKQENSLLEYVTTGQLEKAKRCIEIYETGSGLFDAEGNILDGHEIYYYVKGLYCLETGQYREAEKLFRKLFKFDKDINDLEAAYRGLLLLYKKVNNLDSIGKYAQLYCEINDSLQIKNKNAEVSRMQAAFNYEMHKQKSEKLAQTVRKQQKMMWISIIAFIVVAIVSGESFRRYKNKKIQEYLEEKDHYNEKIALIQKLNSDKEAQKKIIDNLIAETKQLKNAIDSEVKTEQTDSDSCQNEKLVHNLHIKALKPIDASQYFDDDKWHDILKYAEKTDSRFVSYLYQRDLSLMEKKVAVLIRLDFSDNEIMALLDCSYGSSYSNCKLRINKKLFKTESAKRLRYYISKWK